MNSLEKKFASSPKLLLKKIWRNQYSWLIGLKLALIIMIAKVQYHECKEYGHVVSHCKKRHVCFYGKESGHISVNAGTDLKNEQLKINFKAYKVSVEEKVKGNSDHQSSVIASVQQNSISDEVHQLVQSTISSTINTAFSAIGLTGRYSQLCPLLNPIWISDSEALHHMIGAYKGTSYPVEIKSLLPMVEN